MMADDHPRHYEEGHDDKCGCVERPSPAEQEKAERDAERSRPIPSMRDQDE